MPTHLPSSHRSPQFSGFCQPAFPDVCGVPGHRDVDLCLDVETGRVQRDFDGAKRPGALRGKQIEGKRRKGRGNNCRLLAFMPRSWKAPRIEFIVLKDRNIPFEQDLQLPGHVAPIGRRPPQGQVFSFDIQRLRATRTRPCPARRIARREGLG